MSIHDPKRCGIKFNINKTSEFMDGNGDIQPGTPLGDGTEISLSMFWGLMNSGADAIKRHCANYNIDVKDQDIYINIDGDGSIRMYRDYTEKEKEQINEGKSS